MKGKKNRLAIFASGSGSNAEKIFHHFISHETIEIVLLLSNNPKSFALKRAENFGVQTIVFNKEELNNGSVLNDLLKFGITHIILAGFLWLIPDQITGEFNKRIINIHPSLLPAFGGSGMYGMRVHEAVKKSGVLETGITIHEVNEQYDKGKIIFQAKCSLTPEDDPESIANKVHALEYEYFPSVIESWILEVPLTT